MYQMVKMTMYTNTVVRWMRKYSGSRLNIPSQISTLSQKVPSSPILSQKVFGAWGMPGTLPPPWEQRSPEPSITVHLSALEANIHFSE